MSHDSWLRCFERRPNARVSLLCLPFAAGSATSYRSWYDSLPADIEVSAFQLPGREDRLRESPFLHMEPLIAELVEVARQRDEKPTALFGHSMGALVGFELACALESIGQPPVHLFVSGRRAADLPRRLSALRHLEDAELLDAVDERYNGIPVQVREHPELLELFAPLLRADLTVDETYRFRPGIPLGCSLTALGGDDDHSAQRAELEAWRQHTSKSFGVHILPGDHFYLSQQPGELFEIITRDLRTALRRLEIR